SDYWVLVCDKLALGLVERGLEMLARTAAAEFPGNPVFKTCLELLTRLQKGAFPSLAGHSSLRILFLSANPMDPVDPMNAARLRVDVEFRTISGLAQNRPG